MLHISDFPGSQCSNGQQQRMQYHLLKNVSVGSCHTHLVLPEEAHEYGLDASQLIHDHGQGSLGLPVSQQIKEGSLQIKAYSGVTKKSIRKYIGRLQNRYRTIA